MVPGSAVGWVGSARVGAPRPAGDGASPGGALARGHRRGLACRRRRPCRREFRPGDLIVAAPAWADPLMRMHAGDLLPISIAARMDDARFGRVWVISQKRAHASEEAGRTVTYEGRFGALTLRRFEGSGAGQLRLRRAVAGRRGHQLEPGDADQHALSLGSGQLCLSAVRQHRRGTLVEVDQQIRRAVLAPPAPGVITAVEWPAVALGKELAVAAGLHDTWARSLRAPSISRCG